MQQHSSAHAQREFSISRLRLAAILAWTVLAIITAIWECHDSREFKNSNALAMARASIDKDIVFRSWAAGHGGVYVPVTGKTPP
ncbi:MAG: histidine kinase, partial [Deltaproteobacteria bacterium]|nr:histidine kinase [Deltaproteobacteria bacterium]